MRITRGVQVLMAWGFVLLASQSTVRGQATGNILGSISDASAARIPEVTVSVSNKTLGIERSITTTETGSYVFSSLPPGDYEIVADHGGFKKTLKRATVNVGRDVTVDFILELGEVAQAIEVSSSSSTINLVDSKVDSIIERSQISDLPLNGRSAYEMAKLVPGVRVTTSNSRNNDTEIFIVGKVARAVRVTADGMNVSEILGGGGTGMNFANEVVQEFQVNISNSDPSIGISSGGAVNLVTRSGTSAYHGSAFGFFRDAQYAAFSGLSRPVLTPNPNNDPKIAAFNDSQTNPPFWRRQFGGIISGPILKDRRLFGLASFDESRHNAAASFDTNSADLAAFNLISNYPRTRRLQNYRLDWTATDKHSFFARFSRDMLNTRTSGRAALPATYTSTDVYRQNASYMAMAAWTAVWTPTLVSDVRVGFTHWALNRPEVDESAQEARLYAPSLDRMGMVTVSGTNMIFGSETGTPQTALIVQPQFIGNFTYTHQNHTWKFGASYTPVRFWSDWPTESPFAATVFNPTQARQAGISVPATFTTIGDLLQLPLNTILIGVGKNATYPYSFSTNGYNPLWSPQTYAYLGDSWRATRRLTLNWSLRYSYDTLTVRNRDMPRPRSLTPLVSASNLDAPDVKHAFSPVAGFAWDPTGSAKTAIRGGFGIYFDTAGVDLAVRERSILAPVGNGYVSVPGTFFTNPKTGVGTLNFGSAAANASAGILRMSDIVNSISGLRADLERTVFTGTNRDFSSTNFDFFKGVASNTAILPQDQKKPYSIQNMIGIQHQFSNDWLADATFIYNISNQGLYVWDANRLFRPGTSGGPVIPTFGEVYLQSSGGKAVYKGLLLSTKKRLANRYQFTASYALSSAMTEAGNLDYSNRRATWGYDLNNRRHVINASATVDLPWNFQASLLLGVQSRPAFAVTLNNIDLNGDGTSSDWLPGTTPNGGNMVASADDIRTLSADFNQKYAGQRDARGTVMRAITLPEKFQLGDTSFIQDFRLTKKFNLREGMQLHLIGEAFNLLNVANLTYAASAGNILGTGFGQPTGRFGNFFGSEGPRAFQFAARVNF